MPPTPKPRVRYKALLNWYKTRHGDEPPKGAYDRYLFKLLVGLGKLYDDNSDELRRELAKDRGVRDANLIENLRHREIVLNAISHYLRIGLRIDIVDMTGPYSKNPLTKKGPRSKVEQAHQESETKNEQRKEPRNGRKSQEASHLPPDQDL